MKIGIVADDLTGAMDAAVPFADFGIGTRVTLDGQAGSGLADEKTPVVSVDANSRDSSPEKAADAVCRAMEKLVKHNRRLPFKKIDSTLRGNIGAEAIAALLGSGRRQAIIAPAAPQLGRQLREGRLVVHGELIGAQDLVEMLRAQLPGVPVQRLVPGEEITTTSHPLRLLVADAEQDSHLDYLVDVTLARSDEMLLVGSSGLASALARRIRTAGAAAPIVAPDRCRRILFVVGSRNPRSAAQVRTLLAGEGVADLGVSLRGGSLEHVRSPYQQLSGLGVVYVTGLEDAPLMDPEETAGQLAAVAVSLMAGDVISDLAIVLTGGHTARTTLDRLGVRVMKLFGSLDPGVVLGSADVGGHRVSIVTKAGGFGDAEQLTRIAAQLLAR